MRDLSSTLCEIDSWLIGRWAPDFGWRSNIRLWYAAHIRHISELTVVNWLFHISNQLLVDDLASILMLFDPLE